MKIKHILSSVFAVVAIALSGCSNQASGEANEQNTPVAAQETANMDASDIKPVYLTAQDFKEKIWDYEKNPQEWVYNGELPCIIDFYADWCKPCKMVAPIMDDLADHYDGKVLIYKVNTDEQKELASVFQIRSIPSILFAPMDGKPAMQAGAMSKEDYIRIIDEFVLKANNQNNEKTES
jgi:thioredoxin